MVKFKKNRSTRLMRPSSLPALIFRKWRRPRRILAGGFVRSRWTTTPPSLCDRLFRGPSILSSCQRSCLVFVHLAREKERIQGGEAFVWIRRNVCGACAIVPCESRHRTKRSEQFHDKSAPPIRTRLFQFFSSRRKFNEWLIVRYRSGFPSKICHISDSISSSLESTDMNRRPESTVLFHSLRVRKRNEKQKELRERREEKVKDPYIVSCETTTSGPVSNYRRGVDSTVRFSRWDKGGGRRGGAPRSRERKVRIRGVGESHTGHRTGTIFFRCPPFSILKTDSWPEVTRRDSRSREWNFGHPFLNERKKVPPLLIRHQACRVV